MRPELREEEYVFASVAGDSVEEYISDCLMSFRENEGITLIVERDIADDAGFGYDRVWRLITLQVHSDLEAVGFLAAITKHFATKKISVNVVSAFFHDHLFVRDSDTEKALALLQEMQDST
jgi:hypothetical protein